MNVLFDLDGTLTDSRPGILACIRHALERCGSSPPSELELRRCIGPPLRHSFARLLASDIDSPCVVEAINAYRERFTATGMFENAVYERIPAVLDELVRRGARLYVATSKPQVYARRILEHFNLHDRFLGIFGSELDGTRDDKSELVTYAMARAALKPAETVMIGDREHDMHGAVRNDVFPAGVLWGYGSEHELRAAGAKLLLNAPMEIPQVLNALSR